MKIKSIIGIIFCTLLVAIVSGCASNTAEMNLETIEAQIEENIVGSWKSSSAYMSFFENGEMALFNASSGNGEIIPYEVEGDTVILNAKAATMKLLSVRVNDERLTYISEQGYENEWESVSDEEAMAALE